MKDKIRFNVIQEDIDKAVASGSKDSFRVCFNCIIANALNRTTKKKWEVGFSFAHLINNPLKEYKLSPKALVFTSLLRTEFASSKPVNGLMVTLAPREGYQI